MAEGFDGIFKKQEYLFLLGKEKRGLYLLTAILFLTFFALGHIIGGQKELNRRMSNPFTNWVNVPVLTSNTKAIDLFDQETSDIDFLDSFHINSVIPYEITWFKGLVKDFESSRKLTARSISSSDPLFDVILSNDNVIAKSQRSQESQCDVIMTQDALSLLDFDINSSDFLLPIYDNEYDDKHITMLLTVSNIVRELPGDVDLIISDKLMRLLNSNAEKSGFIDQGMRDRFQFMSPKPIKETSFEGMIPDSIVIDNYQIEELDLNNSPLVLHTVELRKEISFSNFLNIQKTWHNEDAYTLLELNCNAKPDVEIDPYYYALNFNELSKVKDFRAHAKEKYDLILSLAQVESRDNFYLISRLTSLLIVLLVILSGFSIVLYLQNIVSNHLEKIKPNLGTLKAFGLSDKRIGDLYINIISKFYLMGSIFALAGLMLYKFLQYLFKLNLHFALLDFRLLIVWLTIYLLLYFLFKRLISKMLYKSPGDLIYNR